MGYGKDEDDDRPLRNVRLGTVLKQAEQPDNPQHTSRYRDDMRDAEKELRHKRVIQ
jgi:hypothetical protein